MAFANIFDLSSWRSGVPTTPAMSSPTPPPINTARRDQEPVTSPFVRQAKQLGFFLAGAGFMAASIAVSRRSVLRKRIETFPPFYVSNRSPARFDAADRQLLAAQALGLATLNVMSFGIMLVGGVAWAFDLSNVEELRQRTNASLRKNVGIMNAEEEKEAEKELEKMMDDWMEKFGLAKPEKESTVDKKPPTTEGNQ